jgi:multidrug efflux pump subunit AcrA (membrane-fusion protein)
MKFNLLYLVWCVALGGFWYIAKNLQTQSQQQLFGIAETEGQLIKFEYPVFVQKSFMRTGQQVKKGDTLFVLIRSELDKQTTEKVTELAQLETEKSAKNIFIEKEKELFDTKQAARISDLQAQIKVIQSEIALQESLRKSLNGNEAGNNTVKTQEIAVLQELINQTQKQTVEQQQLFDSQRISNNAITASKARQIENELGFISKERTKLIVLSPCDGFVEQVYVMNSEITPNYKDLIKINPFTPSKIIGFIPEMATSTYKLGDSVTLVSATRPLVTAKTQIIGVSPKLVELPFRLRRFAEVKAWGREVYMPLAAQNTFFIGEKVYIKFNVAK